MTTQMKHINVITTSVKVCPYGTYMTETKRRDDGAKWLLTTNYPTHAEQQKVLDGIQVAA